jgi:4-hydroxybenzoate polyprenyltransferase
MSQSFIKGIILQRFFEVLKAINELIMFKHSVFSLPFIFISMIVASSSINGSVWFGWGLLILGLLAAISARNFAMAFNRYADRDIDKHNPRTAARPSVDGRIGEKNLLLFIAINAFVFIVVAFMINSLAFWLSFPILFILASYSIFKRFSSYAHLVLGVSLGLAPIAGVVAVSESITLWSVMLALGVMFWVAGFDLLYSLQDIEFDKKEGLFSIPSVYGKDATFFISRLFHALTILFWLFFVIIAELGVWAYMALFVSAVTLYMEHRIVLKDFTKIDRAFFTLNGYLGIIFFIFILIDRF